MGDIAGGAASVSPALQERISSLQQQRGSTLPSEEIVAVVGHVLGDLNGVPSEQRITPQDVAAARKWALPPNEVRRMREQ